MTAAEFTAIVVELHARAKAWLEEQTKDCGLSYTEVPPLWVIGVRHIGTGFQFCCPAWLSLPRMPVCWISWETSRSDDELRDVLGQALSVLMRELGMEWPRC